LDSSLKLVEHDGKLNCVLKSGLLKAFKRVVNQETNYRSHSARGCISIESANLFIFSKLSPMELIALSLPKTFEKLGRNMENFSVCKVSVNKG